MPLQNLAANALTSSNASALLKAKRGLQGNADSAGVVAGALTYRRRGLHAAVGGETFARGRLSSRLLLSGAQVSTTTAARGDMGAQRNRSFGIQPCEAFWIEADGSARGPSLLQFNARWQRYLKPSDDSIEWTEGKRPTMSNSPTHIINPGAPITNDATGGKLWIDACSYDPDVSWLASGATNQIIEAKFFSAGRGFALTSTVENPEIYRGSYTMQVPHRVYTARFEGKNRFDIRLADASNTRGLRLGYAYQLTSDRVYSSQSGDFETDFHFTVPETLTWHLALDYYIKTACDFKDPAQERNVAYIHHETELTTSIFEATVDGTQRLFWDGPIAFYYMDMDQGLMDAGMERHATALFEKLDNAVAPEDAWQMYPIRLDNIAMKIKKQDSRLEFQLANQYPALTYVDRFVNRALALFLNWESPVWVETEQSVTEI